MPIPFPSIKCPGRRSFTPGDFPIREFVAQNGAVTKIARGDRLSDAKLDIEIPYMPDAEVASILNLWMNSIGSFRTVSLPANAFEGMSPAVVATIPSYLDWYMNEPSIRDSGRPNYSAVTLSFRGLLPA